MWPGGGEVVEVRRGKRGTYTRAEWLARVKGGKDREATKRPD